MVEGGPVVELVVDDVVMDVVGAAVDEGTDVVVAGECVVGATAGTAAMVGGINGRVGGVGDVGTVMTTTIDCGGAFGGAAEFATTESGVNVLSGILATASSNLRCRSVTSALSSLAWAITTSRLSRSAESRSDERMLSVTPIRVTIAERIAPPRMACAGLSVRTGGGVMVGSAAGVTGLVSSALTPATVVPPCPSPDHAPITVLVGAAFRTGDGCFFSLRETLAGRQRCFSVRPPCR